MPFILNLLLLPYSTVQIKSWLTSIDEGCTHQGSWGWVGDVGVYCANNNNNNNK